MEHKSSFEEEEKEKKKMKKTPNTSSRIMMLADVIPEEIKLSAFSTL